MRKITMKTILLLTATTILLAACQPPMARVTRNGEPCHPVGYGFAPVWVSPDGGTACMP
jgi:hypothetical protein